MCHGLFMLYIKTQLVRPQIWDGRLSFCFSYGTLFCGMVGGLLDVYSRATGLMNGIKVAGLYIESFKR